MQECSCLYHYPICPFCRKIRVMLSITGAIEECTLKIEKFWEKRNKFITINPTGSVPLFIVQKIADESKKDNYIMWGQNTIIQYLRDKYPMDCLLYGNSESRANILKYAEWFDSNFYNDAVYPLINERVYVYYKKQRIPNLDTIKIARSNLISYLSSFEKILTNRDFIIGNEFSFADMTLACHISSLDYLGEIDWNQFGVLKNWYIQIKSKLIFRDILYDIIPDFNPSEHYRDIDF